MIDAISTVPNQLVAAFMGLYAAVRVAVIGFCEGVVYIFFGALLFALCGDVIIEVALHALEKKDDPLWPYLAWFAYTTFILIVIPLGSIVHAILVVGIPAFLLRVAQEKVKMEDSFIYGSTFLMAYFLASIVLPGASISTHDLIIGAYLAVSAFLSKKPTQKSPAPFNDDQFMRVFLACIGSPYPEDDGKEVVGNGN